METKDVRMKKTSEILSGIKYVKMCGTENKFLDNVNFLYTVAIETNWELG